MGTAKPALSSAEGDPGSSPLPPGEVDARPGASGEGARIDLKCVASDYVKHSQLWTENQRCW